MIGSTNISSPQIRGTLRQGCSDGSLYDDGAYGVPNGNSLPYVLAAQSVSQLGFVLVTGRTRAPVITLIDRGLDPYAGVTQSRYLREIGRASFRDNVCQ